jgi:HD-like signal output (HDOD) protein
MSAAVPRVLFVDDEPRVLQGLKAGFWRFRGEWETEYACGGAEALALLAGQPFDVIVSDMRMPGMDGEALLRRVQADYPDVVRVVLSGQTDRDVAARMVHVAHQFLAKPCEVSVIRQRLQDTLSLRSQFAQPGVRAIVSGLGQLQVVSSVKNSLKEVLSDSRPVLEPIVDLVLQDSALCAKVLQIVNSAFFGPPRQLSAVREAVRVLGTESLRAALRRSDPDRPDDDSAEHARLQTTANTIAAVAHRIAHDLSLDTARALGAGLLSTLGARVFCSYFAEEHAEVQREALEQGVVIQEVELRRFGTTHTQVGAYLAGLWGLEPALITALAAQGPNATAALEPNSLGWLLNVASTLVEDASGARPRYFVELASHLAHSESHRAEWRAAALAAVAASRA